MTLSKKTPKESQVIKTELVLPNDTNTFNNLMGGRLLHLMDICSAICAQRHSGSVVVTASVDNVSFSQPIALGEVVNMKATVTRAFKSSMEVFIEVTAEDAPGGVLKPSNSAYFTFVAVGDDNKPRPVPEVEPETEEEKAQHAGALRRRQLRLVLAGRMKPDEAKELKSIFFDE
ncbi:acyl-CoA thioesterase [Reichenbachiella ulvae]|uniref:Acyl-CoA thioesterase n=1 Tax=Reichenbachiella ulvae TaxID=2980104 RepID=A0ABT3CTI7_9BACT|nr:acyl-CoA thioesterase [Reichenbachiella ulvae]MCV9386548.1 acyl-CoA thioesterase [Reichenbachiella ulvae]